MPGQPKTREMMDRIETAGGAQALLERISAGETMISIARALDVSRSVISGLLNDEHAEALKEARKRAATVYVEEALEIADAATPATERVEKLKADTRRWLAGRWDRAAFGDNSRPDVQVNIGALHIEALRHYNVLQKERLAHVTPALTS